MKSGVENVQTEVGKVENSGKLGKSGKSRKKGKTEKLGKSNNAWISVHSAKFTYTN